MKISLSWLKDYIDINIPPAQIAKMLTSAGMEVESFETIGQGFRNVVVAQVTSAEKHPNADNLVVAQVNDGSTAYQVVCGAKNCRTGLKTALARIGAVLKDETGKEFKIKQTKLRGVESSGMLCSGMELGLSDENDGIMEFAEHMPLGADVSEMYADVLFEISLTPNLAHCNSFVGIARELSALTGLPLKIPSFSIQENFQEKIEDNVKVSVQDKIKCPRYACRLIKNVDIKTSPDWLKKRLDSCGIRPINAVVDVTNYLMLELGHPMHAFDFDKLKGNHIIVKGALENERFMTLDDKERVLKSSDLVICDRDGPVAIAGVMGGLNTEVTMGSKNILLEAAYFQPATIRKTSKRLNLSSESSKRFERGCDPNAVINALNRAAMLIREFAGGEIVAGAIDVKEHDFLEKEISCRHAKLNSILGTHLSVSEVESIFNRLYFKCQWNGQDAFIVKVPTFRVDVNAEIDLVEEVARIYGYDNIPMSSAKYSTAVMPHSPMYLFEREVRSRLLSEGLQEFLTCDLIGPTLSNIVQDNTMPSDSIVSVLNPTSVEQSFLRTSLLPGLLEVVKYNHDHQNPNISGFEIGRIHFKKDDVYKEQSVVGVVLTGKSRPHHWEDKPKDVDFYDLKGLLENIFKELRVPTVRFSENALEMFHSGRQASMYVDSLEIGSFGEIHPSIQRRLDVPHRIYFAEVNLHDLIRVRIPEQKMVSISLFPCSERDWTVTLNNTVPIEKIVEMIRSLKSTLLENVYVLDIYHSDKLGKDKKNATFHFIYRDTEKTVEQEEVEKEHHNIINQIASWLETL